MDVDDINGNPIHDGDILSVLAIKDEDYHILVFAVSSVGEGFMATPINYTNITIPNILKRAVIIDNIHRPTMFRYNIDYEIASQGMLLKIYNINIETEVKIDPFTISDPLLKRDSLWERLWAFVVLELKQ